MKQIKYLKKHRWFIWAIVVIIGGLGFLATYVYSVSSRDESEVPVLLKMPQNIMESTVAPALPISQQEAAYVVKNIPQVKEFLRTHSKARVVPDELINLPSEETPYWPVHVFEDFKDHTKSYSWFNVYMESGVIIKK